MSEIAVFTIWHADGDAPDVARRSITIGVGGADDEARVRRAAELAAVEDADAIDREWPTDYRVLDDAGRLWSVRVDRVTRPTYAAVDVLEMPPMLPAVHVLWQGQVACEDARLAGVPSTWPEGQRWMSLTEFAAGSDPVDDARCEVCWRRAPALRRGAL